tara:strand:- start:528 stop:1925 length:1398 start_codon:yes stop_codon:yes gene_type:complete
MRAGLHRSSFIALAAIFISCLGQLSHAQQSTNEASAANLMDEPYGWNDAKRADASELLEVYDNDLKQIDAVGDAAIYAVLAAAAYRGEEGTTTDMENLAMSKGFVVYRQALKERLIVGDLTATLFLHPDGRAILAFRGSTPIGDWVTNFDSLNNNPLLKGQVRDAVDLAKTLQGSYPNIELTGHSLGGRLAQVAAVNAGRPAYAFNSAPLSRKEVADYALSSLDGVDIHRFRTPQDVVSTLTAPTDIRVENYVEADAIIDRCRVGNAHGMDLMALSMLHANTARNEGWVSHVLKEQAAARLSGNPSGEETGNGLMAQVSEIYGLELDVAMTTQSSTPMFADSLENEMAGTWVGSSSAGSTQINLKIEVTVSSPVTVSAEISLKLPSDAQWSTYHATGSICGRTLRLNGNRWVSKHNQQFCLTSYIATRPVAGKTQALSGSWGLLPDHPNGCPKGSSGGIWLVKQP